jgi:LmbE family N-acetylglucosaminyl deacetylase
MLRQRGAQVMFTIGTRGGKGWRGPARGVLEILRSRHQMSAARVLGGAEVLFYDYPDKGLSHYIRPFSEDIRSLISIREPDLVLSWDPEHIFNPHFDHQAAAESAREALQFLPHPPRVCYYGTRQPNLWVGYGDDVFRTKLRALGSHRTELVASLMYYGRKYLIERSRGEGEKIGSPYAEVFRCEDRLH